MPCICITTDSGSADGEMFAGGVWAASSVSARWRDAQNICTDRGRESEEADDEREDWTNRQRNWISFKQHQSY